MKVKYQELKETRCLGVKESIDLVIEDCSELPIQELNNLPDVKNIIIYVIMGPKSRPIRHPIKISRQDYILSRKIIDKIVDEASQNSSCQKEIFAKIYSILSRYAQNDGEELLSYYLSKKDIYGIARIQGLAGFLIDNFFTCFGVAFTLFNVCRCAGIDALVINGNSTSSKYPRNHSWNIVKLDGQWYNSDFRWDLKKLKSADFPLNEFLKSSKDFNHDEFFEYYFKDIAQKHCTVSFEPEKQLELFNGSPMKDQDILDR